MFDKLTNKVRQIKHIWDFSQCITMDGKKTRERMQMMQLLRIYKSVFLCSSDEYSDFDNLIMELIHR